MKLYKEHIYLGFYFKLESTKNERNLIQID